MIKVKDGYAKLIGTTALGTADRVLLSNGGDFGLHTGRNNEADKIVRTDASGYILAGWINTTSGDMGTTAIDKIYCSNDGFIRYKTPANFFSTLANDSNLLSITVGSLNRKLIVAYASNADTLDGYHADDILPYGLENLCVGAVASGRNTTLNSDGSITTSGINSDTYFYVRCTENLIAGLIYTVGFYVTGVPSGNTTIWSFSFDGQANKNLIVPIKSNGWCWGTGTIPNDIATDKIIIFDDWYRGFYNSINISKFVIVKGRQRAYYTPPISRMSVNYATSAGNAATATKLTTSAGNAALPIYFSDGKPVTCVASSIFSNLSNDGNNISITVAGLNRTLTVNYANSAGSVVWNNIIGKPDTFPVATHNHDDKYVKLNGTSVMSGDLTLSLRNNDRFIVFSYPGTVNPDSNSWRTGVLGSGDGEANYYVVQYQRINTGSSTWNTAFKIGQTTGTVTFTNNITIGDKVNYHTGNLAPQTLTLSTSPQTYITANGTNYTLKLPNSDPYTSARTPTAHTHPYLPLAGGTMNQGSHVVFPGTSTDASYGGSIEFREVDYVATNQTDWSYAPGITFHWGGRSVGKLGLRSDGDLAWRDLSIIHSGNINSLSVNYANSAGYTKRLYANSISGLTTHPGDYSLAYSRFQAGVSNIFPTINNANGVITAHLHYGDYFAQIGLSSDGRMYYRTMMDLTLDAGVTWNKVAWTTDIPTKVSQLTNDSGFITGGPYLPLTGGTLSGNLTVGLKDANRTISIAGNTSHLKMIAHTNATYIESGNKDWDGNTPLLITGYSGNQGSNLYLNFANIYCRSGSNSYVNLDSGNWSNYITVPTLYKRNLGINGTDWTFSSPYNTAAPTIYAPTSAGTSGQVLVSNGGGAPSWKTLSIKDTDISWSTTSLLGLLSIMEMAYSNVHSSNKLAFGKVEGITLEYSQNGGSSWVELTGDAWDLKKLNLISGISSSVSTGNRTTGNTANDRLRITLNAVAMGIYTWPRKLLININTNVTTEPYATVKVEYSTIGNPTSYTVYGTYNISGWSGWNSIPLTSLWTFGGASNQTSNILNIRLTFANNNANKYLTIQDIYMIGLTNWLNPSNMSKTGHLYDYNYNLDMILPASLSLGGVNNLNNKISYLAPEGYLYIIANNINSNKTGGIVIKTTKNSVVSQVLLASDSDYGKVTITGDLCIGGRALNTTALISSDAQHNMYFSVQEKILLVCDSSEESIRCGYDYVGKISLGTASCPWEGLYVENGVKLKGKTNYFSILAPNGTHSSDEIFSLPYTGGTLVTTNSPAMVKGWATYSFSYTNGTSSTYTMTFKAGGGVNIVGSPSYYEYYNGPGILIRIDNNCKDTLGTIKDSLMVWGLASDAKLSLYITKTTVLVSGSTVHYYLVCCKNTSGTDLTSGSGTLNFIYF